MRFKDAETAIKAAVNCSTSVDANFGLIARVIVIGRGSHRF